jgi:hypothetical protein
VIRETPEPSLSQAPRSAAPEGVLFFPAVLPCIFDTCHDISLMKIVFAGLVEGPPHEYSIVIQRNGGDLDVERVRPLLQDWADEHCTSAIFSTERGEKDNHLHFQGVIRTRKVPLATARGVTRNLKTALSFDNHGEYVSQGNVRTKLLKNAKLHTFEGMVGYCMKDKARPWYTSIQVNIDEATIDAGEQLYLQYGASTTSKGFITLSPYTIFHRATLFYRLYFPDSNLTFRRILLEMHKSGKYAPDGKWIIKRAGEGLNVNSAEAAWRLMRDPQNCTERDIGCVYFDMFQSDVRAELAYMQYAG